ncbi:MAG: glutaredoxin family protein [bacterium]|nr:glutaredoxin family protein [bacterium]
MNIILYTKTGCPWCKEVLNFFAEKGIKFEEREVTGNKNYYDELVAKSGQDKTPTMDIDGEIYADTDREAIEKILNLYPLASTPESSPKDTVCQLQ